MTERTPIIPEAPEAQETAAEVPVPTKRPPGRPEGTDYRRADAPLHERMRQLLKDGVVPSRTAAPRLLAHMACGHGCPDSKIRQLVRWLRY
jgi:hypothetical protein